ncbi:MAG: hypothetical protein CVU17_11500 [Betaproteobacteria bacterium HGW-Betaproteobacteria-11]|nr:MAG: hypothetical protein CVU17_11500 [Betaproteobacteria bacterium HGW-Betaproteobacteria-11]
MMIQAFFVAISRLTLPALLGALFLAFLSGIDSLAGKGFFIVHLGLFMLWQPFVQGNQRLSLSSLLGIFMILAVIFSGTGGWLFVIWVMSLAAVMAGRVALINDRLLRITYQLAFAFLLLELLLVAVPDALTVARVQPQLSWIANLFLVFLIWVILLLQWKIDQLVSQADVMDFFSGLVVFLVLATLILGSLSAMLTLGSSYTEALLQSMLLIGSGLLLLGWAWNPHGGFAGLGDLFSRYLLSIGLPIERWLNTLANLALEEDDPEIFLSRAIASIVQSLRWVSGVEWVSSTRNEHVGLKSGYRSEYELGELTLRIFTKHQLTASLRFHLGLLVKLLAEFYADKRRALDLRNLSYVQAVHEAGARLTHDIKNILQSLNALCVAGNDDETGASPEYQLLLKRQLPVVADRLGATLLKLQSPSKITKSINQPVVSWWNGLVKRLLPNDWIYFSPLVLEGDIPGDVFTGVIDNLVQNAIEKRQHEPALRVRIELARKDNEVELIVCDDGSALPDPIASALFKAPVASKTGLGIGLYQASRYAESAGYSLSLSENRHGRVCFCLAPHSRESVV